MRTLPHCVLASVLGVSFLLGAACHSGPEVTGPGLGNGRIVSRGDIFEIRLPIDDEGNQIWRVESYDSARVEIVSRPEVVRGDGHAYVKARVRAGTPGKTDIVFGRVGLGPGDRTKTFTINILE